MNETYVKEMKQKYGKKFIGNVIRIIDSQTLLVNVGKYDLKVGDIIQVYEHNEEILDLDGTPIGNYEFIKGELEVIQTEDAYSVCKSNATVTKAAPLFALSPLLEKEITSTVPLNVNSKDIKPVSIANPKITIGDPVKKA